MVVTLQERIDLTQTKKIFRSLIFSLGHLHEKKMIHGDFKPLNAVRMVCRKGDRVGDEG